MRRLKVVVYGDVDLNLLDGSAVWAQSMTMALAGVENIDVTLLLKAPVRTDRLIAPLEGQPNITVRRTFEEELLPGLSKSVSPFQLVSLFELLDQEGAVDAFFIRGTRIASRLAIEPSLQGRLWTYLTDFPQSPFDFSEQDLEQLTSIVDASGRVLCQTEDLRSHLEQMVPSSCGKTILSPPVVEGQRLEGSIPEVDTLGRSYRLVYTGKMAPDWRTEQMADLPQKLASHGLAVEMHMVGDKIHSDRKDPNFFERMERALTKEGVVRHGGVPRRRSLEIASTCDIGMCWRSNMLDSSLELSTKLLEFGTLGLPSVVNRTSAHERLLGQDYELFVDRDDDVVPLVAKALEDPEMLARAGARCASAASFFELERATERLGVALNSLRPEPIAMPSQGLKVVIASHDLKFMTRLIEELRLIDGIEIRLDEWASLSEHDEEESQSLLDWADVVVCEWCGPNAIWYSERVHSRQRLIVRLHRFELYGSYPGNVKADSLDTVVTVNDHYRDLVRQRLPWEPERVVSIPNWVDIASLDREKLQGARFNVGMIGIAPRRKRLDRALDVLERVRGEDPRFTLFIKSKMPWDYWWIWNDAEEQKHYREALRRIQTSPALRGAVVFDPFGPDVGNWLRKIGSVLSTSDDESFHLSPAEGMASGAVPVVFPWPGAETVYSERWIVRDVEDAAKRVLALGQNDALSELGQVAREEVEEIGLPRVTRMWASLLAAGCEGKT